MSRKIKWGIIGCGDVCEHKSGPAFYKIRGSQLEAVMRRNHTLAEDFANRHHVPKFYSNASNLINDKDINAIYIATPPAFHLPYAKACAEAGKAVYVEKPMAKNYDECLEMISVFRKYDVPLYVAYYRRALPKFLLIKKLIDDNQIGTPLTFTTVLHKPPLQFSALPWRLKPEISGGGLFVDLACHILDIYDMIFGPVQEARGIALNQNNSSPTDDLVTAVFSFASGVSGTGNWCFNSHKRIDENKIYGTKGMITFGNHGTEPILVESDDGKRSISYDQPEHIEQPFIEKIVNSLKGVEHFPSNAESASRISWAMDEILKTYYKIKQ